jgi:hypothetical protein
MVTSTAQSRQKPAEAPAAVRSMPIHSSVAGSRQPAPQKESIRIALGLPLPGSHRTKASKFIQEKAIPLLAATLGTGLIVGILLRRWERSPTPASPVQQITEGSRGLAFAGTAATVGFASRLLSKLVNVLPKGRIKKEAKRFASKADSTAEELRSRTAP